MRSAALVGKAVLLLVLVAGCQDSRKTNPPPPRPAVALDSTIPISSVPWTGEDRDPKPPYDCTMVPALAMYFPGLRVENCGVLEIEATDAQKSAAKKCVEAAVAGRRPFLFVQRVQGEDSGVLRAFLARMEGSDYVAYEASYDSDPCGGGCPERGHTYLSRCKGPPTVPKLCDERVAACIECDDHEIIDQCAHGRPSKFSLTDSERARRALFAAKPTALGPAFGPLVVGALVSEWKSPAGVAAREAIEAGGIVDVTDRTRQPSAAHIDTIGFMFAGPCSHIHDELTKAWGPEVAHDRWVDRDGRRTALLDPWDCYLAVMRYVEPEEWAAKDITAPFPIVPTGMKAADWVTKVGGELVDGSPRWRAPAFGTSGAGPIEMYADVSHGRVTSYGTGEVNTDEASIARLRDHLTKLLGPAKHSDADFTTWVWRGKPTVTLSAMGDGSFSLTAD